MRLFTRLLATCLALGLLAAPATAIPEPLEVHQTPVRRLADTLDHERPMPGLVAQVAAHFLGTPYGAQGWNATYGVACDWNAFDCVTLVESSLALARVAAEGRASQAAYAQELLDLRYRDGRKQDFASRLHYFTDWIRDNERRGRVRDITAELGGERDTREIHYMTRHWDQYQKVKVEADFVAMRVVERALTDAERYVLPKARVKDVLDRLESGDIIAMATNIEGLDVVHTGLVYRKPDGAVHLLHAPVPGDVVSVSTKPLVDYLKVFDAHVGVVVARPLKPVRPWWQALTSWDSLASWIRWR
ncbi:MAG: N-acetylmuramoyl-L-alanine amidase-like domain-containing protein [Candidatus Sericytochromatia bacterium]